MGGMAGALFRQRRLLIRTGGRVREIVLTTRRQLAFAVLLLGMCGVALGGAAALYLGQRAEIERHEMRLAALIEERDAQNRELAMARDAAQSAVANITESDRVFAELASEIRRIETSLHVLAAYRGDSGAAARALLAPAADKCSPAAHRAVAKLGNPGPEGPREAKPLNRGIAQLEQALARLKAGHAAFVRFANDLARQGVSQMETALATVGIDIEKLTGTPLPLGRFGAGGPFVPLQDPGAWHSRLSWFDVEAARWENFNTVVRALPLGSPVADAEITSGFGGRRDPINMMRAFHEGIDFGAPLNTPVQATGDGVVKAAGWRQRYGKTIEIDHGFGITTRYAHLSCMLVQPGQKVRRGTVIGLLGSTGRTTGPHLHYEIRAAEKARDPGRFLKAASHVLEIR